MTMFLSVIIPTYRPGHSLTETIQSVLTQSMEGVCEILLLSGENMNPALPFSRDGIHMIGGFDPNHAIKEACGEYLTFLDVGDRLRSDAVELFMRAAKKHSPQIIMANMNILTAEGFPAVPGGMTRRSLWDGSLFGVLCKRKVLRTYTINSPENCFDEKFAFNNLLGGAQRIHINEPLYYRLKPQKTRPSFRSEGTLPMLGFEDFPILSEAAEDAVVLIGDIDYHLRHLLAIARQLMALGQKCVVFDVSSSRVSLPARALCAKEATKWSDVPLFSFDICEIFPFFPNARAYVFTSDWGAVRPLLFQLKQRRVPTVAFYEGINDDFLLEPPELTTIKNLPYRHADTLLLPGRYYESVYMSYKNQVVGLPDLYARLKEMPTFPATPQALINVNFSYGVLEDKRSHFLGTAIEACEKVSLKHLISQHPADRATLSGNLSSTDIYEDIRNCSLLISRFSTCILEALAMGKPAIYHNPHGEKFPKFQEDPMGAFPVTHSTASLEAAIKDSLRDIEAGVDFRRRATEFLQFHTNIFAEHPPEVYAAQAISDIIAKDAPSYEERRKRGQHAPPLLQAALAEPMAALNSRLGEAFANAPKWKKAMVLLMLDRPYLKSILAAHLKNR